MFIECHNHKHIICCLLIVVLVLTNNYPKGTLQVYWISLQYNRNHRIQIQIDFM